MVNFQDGLVGLEGPLVDPCVGPNMELLGLMVSPGRFYLHEGPAVICTLPTADLCSEKKVALSTSWLRE